MGDPFEDREGGLAAMRGLAWGLLFAVALGVLIALILIATWRLL